MRGRRPSPRSRTVPSRRGRPTPTRGRGRPMPSRRRGPPTKRRGSPSPRGRAAYIAARDRAEARANARSRGPKGSLRPGTSKFRGRPTPTPRPTNPRFRGRGGPMKSRGPLPKPLTPPQQAARRKRALQELAKARKLASQKPQFLKGKGGTIGKAAPSARSRMVPRRRATPVKKKAPSSRVAKKGIPRRRVVPRRRG